MRIQFTICPLTALIFFLIGCGGAGSVDPPPAPPPVRIDLPEILARGKIIAATGYGASSYFIYKGQPMGHEYELLTMLARDLDVELEIAVIRDLDGMFQLLDSGEADIIGLGLTVTKERAEQVAFTDHHNVIRQVLVQRLPEGWTGMKRHEIDRLLIRSPIDLLGKTVHIWSGSSYHARLENLSEEIGGDIDLVGMPGTLSTEDLIAMVADGEIEYTVADEHIATLAQAFHTGIDVRTPVSFPQRIAWAVRKNSPLLRDAVNGWLSEVKRNADFHIVYNKYYRNRSAFRTRAKSRYYSVGGGMISPWDDLIRARAAEIHWVWRLLAALIYQESQFEPTERSWAGAVGLMQLLPETAVRFGARDLYDPAENIRAGTSYLKWLERFWREVPDPEERLKFVLGSYNAGQGHILDARRLALKHGRDPDLWEENVAYYLLKKSSPQFFNDEVVKHGYCRGQEPVSYVQEILGRFEHYKLHWVEGETPLPGNLPAADVEAQSTLAQERSSPLP